MQQKADKMAGKSSSTAEAQPDHLSDSLQDELTAQPYGLSTGTSAGVVQPFALPNGPIGQMDTEKKATESVETEQPGAATPDTATGTKVASAPGSSGDGAGSGLPSSGADPLPDDLRTEMENAFSADFSAVRTAVSGAVSNMGAKAITRGDNIFFAPGAYAPDTASGKKLIGHELTHVLQQRGESIPPTKVIDGVPVNDDPALEAEANAKGASAAEATTAETTSSADSPETANSTAPEDVEVEWYTPRINLKLGETEQPIVISGTMTVRAQTEDGTQRVVTLKDIKSARLQVQTIAKTVAEQAAKKGLFDVESKGKDSRLSRNSKDKNAKAAQTTASRKSTKQTAKDANANVGKMKDHEDRLEATKDEVAAAVTSAANAKDDVRKLDVFGLTKFLKAFEADKYAIGMFAINNLTDKNLQVDMGAVEVVHSGALKAYPDVKKQMEKDAKKAHKDATDAPKELTGLGQTSKGGGGSSEGLVQAIGISGSVDGDTETVNAEVKDYELGTGVLLKDAALSGVWKKGVLREVTGGSATLHIDNEHTKLRVKLRDITGNLKTKKVSGSGDFKLSEAAALGHVSGYDFTMQPSSSGSVTIKNNKVKRFSGDVKIHAARGGVDIFEFKVEDSEGDAKAAKALDVTATGSLLQPIELADKVGPFKSWGLHLAKTTGVDFTLKGGKLHSLGGQVVLGVSENSVEVLRLAVSGTTEFKPGKKPKGTLSKVSTTIVESFKIANLHGFEVWTSPASTVAESAGFTTSMEKSKITAFGGTVPLEFRKGGKPQFAVSLKLEKEFNPAGSSLSGSGKAEILEPYVAATGLGPTSNWTAMVNSGTEMTAFVTNGKPTKIDGTLNMEMLGGAGTAWLKGSAKSSMDFTKQTFNFDGSVDVEQREMIHFTDDSEYWVTKTSNTDLKVLDNTFDYLDGTLGLDVVENAETFAQGEITARYNAALGTMNGSLSGTFIKKRTYLVGDAKTDKVIIEEGTGATLELEGDSVKSVEIAEGSSLRYRAMYGDSPLDLQFTGSGKYSKAKGLESAKGSVKLLSSFSPAKFIKVHRLEAEASAKDNAMESISGKLFASFYDATGNIHLYDGHVEGAWTPEGFTGFAQATLALEQTFSFSKYTARVNKKKTSGKITFEAGELALLSGTLDVDILKSGKIFTNLAAKGTYDGRTNKILDLKAQATFKTEKKLLKDRITLHELSATVIMKDNAVTQATGKAKLTSDKLKVKKASIEFGWRAPKDGDDQFFVKGDISWVFFKKKKKHLKGTLSVFYNYDGTWSATAMADYQMDKDIGGKASVRIDSEMSVFIKRMDLNFSTKLADKGNLFDLNMNLPMKIPVFPILMLEMGLGFGAKFDIVNDIALNTVFVVENWNPTAEDEGMTPTFTSSFAMPMSLLFEAYVAAYVQMALTVYVASIGGGAEARLVLSVPIDITPEVVLSAGPKGFGGAFNLDMAINPELLLQIIPYMFAEIVFVDPWEWPMDPPIEFPIADLGSFGVSQSLKFGENNAVSPAAAKKLSVNSATEKEKSAEAKKIAGKPRAQQPNGGDKAESNEVAIGGGSALSGKGMMAGQQAGVAGATKGPEDETATMMANVEDVLDGLAAIDEFMNWLGSTWDAFKEGGMNGVMHLAYEVYSGNMSFAVLGKYWDRLMEGVKAAGRLLKSLSDDPLNVMTRMGKWMNNEISTWDLIMEADSEVVSLVNKGYHKKKNATVDTFKTMLGILCGWDNACVGDEEWAVVKLLREAGKRGFLKEAVKDIKGSSWNGANQVLYKLEWGADEEARKIFKSYGVYHD